MVPSLESISGVPVVVVISNHPDVKKQIFSSSTIKLFKNTSEQKRWENAINMQTSEILKDYNPVLKSIFPRLRVKFIGIEMLKWTENLQTCFNLPLKFSQDFIKSSFFTSKGIINEEKAARELIKEQSLSLLLKYKIACHFYLQDIVPNLWQELHNNEPDFKKILSKFGSETPMVRWSNYLAEIKSTSVQNQEIITNKFKARVFSCGIKSKNVAAVKFSLDTEGEFKSSKEEREIKIKLLYRVFHDCMRWNVKSFPVKPSLDSLLSKEIVTHFNFIEYVENTMMTKELLLKDRLGRSILTCYLHWPYQYKFMKLAPIAFEILDEFLYFCRLLFIIYFIQEENVNSSYNYRLLLREFWIKSPTHFKKYIIEKEAGEHLRTSNEDRHKEYLLIIERLFRIRPFTSDDMQNVYLIVKEASPAKKRKIFQIQRKNVCSHLCSLGNYKIANFFFNVLEIDQDTVRAFKKDFAFDFFRCTIKKKSTEGLSDEFFKWILGTDEFDELKSEIFYKLNHTNEIVNLFKYIRRENIFSFVDKILKLLLKTDDKIEKWKETILLNVATLYSPLIRNSNPDWFDNLLMYLGTSDKKISDIKRDILMRNFPTIAKCIYENQFFVKNILFLCLYKKERIKNFNNKLRAYYQDSITNKICLFCMNSNHVSSNGVDTHLQCEYHGESGFISPNNVNVICSSFSTRINKTFKRYQAFIKKTFKKET